MSSLAEQQAVSKILKEIGARSPFTPDRSIADIPIIVELGAHTGEDSLWMQGQLKYGFQFVLVEPDARNCQKILDNRMGWGLIIGAVASYSGMTHFYMSENPVSKNNASGSIKKPTGHLKHFKEVTFERSTWVPCYTLDDIATWKKLPRIDLLWCDIQGAEREMIEGGRATLARTRYMMIEAEPEVELYEGQALKPELIAMLPGWEIMQDFGYNLLMRNKEYNA